MGGVIDKRTFTQGIEIVFDSVGNMTQEEVRNLLVDIRIVIEQRKNIERVTIIKL